MNTISTRRTFQVRFTLEEIAKWSKKAWNFDVETYAKVSADPKAAFIKYSEMFPPCRLLTKLRPLIVDEAVDPNDLVIIVVDEETGVEYSYNPPLDSIFSGLTVKPYLNSV